MPTTAGQLLEIMRVRRKMQEDGITNPPEDVKSATHALVEKLARIDGTESINVDISEQTVSYIREANGELLAQIHRNNQPILDWIEERGGGYVWEDEIFAVTLLEASIDDEDAERLSWLTGVQQIAVDPSGMSMTGLKKLAGISGLQSLVLKRGHLTATEVEQLRNICKDVELID